MKCPAQAERQNRKGALILSELSFSTGSSVDWVMPTHTGRAIHLALFQKLVPPKSLLRDATQNNV